MAAPGSQRPGRCDGPRSRGSPPEVESCLTLRRAARHHNPAAARDLERDRHVELVDLDVDNFERLGRGLGRGDLHELGEWDPDGGVPPDGGDKPPFGTATPPAAATTAFSAMTRLVVAIQDTGDESSDGTARTGGREVAVHRCCTRRTSAGGRDGGSGHGSQVSASVEHEPAQDFLRWFMSPSCRQWPAASPAS